MDQSLVETKQKVPGLNYWEHRNSSSPERRLWPTGDFLYKTAAKRLPAPKRVPSDVPGTRPPVPSLRRGTTRAPSPLPACGALAREAVGAAPAPRGSRWWGREWPTPPVRPVGAMGSWLSKSTGQGATAREKLRAFDAKSINYTFM